MVKASIIILNWNGLEFLKDCFESIQKQTFTDFETIMVDNNSQDGSPNYVENVFPWIRVIRNNKNTGQTGGDNTGIKHAKGEYIILLDNDTIVDKNWLKELVVAADSDPKIGMCGSKMYFMDDPRLICSTGLLAFTDGSAIDRGVYEIDKGQYDNKPDIFGPCGGSGLYKKEMLENMKIMGEYMDNEFFAYCEDLDIAYKGRLLGYVCKFAPKSIVYHKVNASSRKISNLGLTCGIKNKMWVVIKNFPTKMLLKYMPFIAMRQVVSFVFYLFIKPSIPATKARVVMIKKIPVMLKKRKIIQDRRKITSDQLEGTLQKRSMLGYLFFRYD
ncbi:MAG: glycosyltransferase family 2 protein [Nanoarchaeota archaeon]|nr:glycosyltransferase family 2 protein [Nanoarchaeota archaeon]